jgi:hypothetical protein
VLHLNQLKTPRRALISSLLIAFSLLALVGSIQTNTISFPSYWVNTVGAAQSATATISVSTTLAITGKYLSDSNCSPSCPVGNATTAVNVGSGKTYWFTVTVRDNGGSTDLGYVAVYLMKPTGGTVKGIWDRQHSYGFRWVPDGFSGCSTTGGCYQELLSGGWSYSLANLNAAGSSHSTIQSGSGSCGILSQLDCQFTFAFTFNWGNSGSNLMPQFTNTGSSTYPNVWVFYAELNGNAGGTTISRTSNFNANLYVSFTIPGGMNWGTFTSGLFNQSVSGNPYSSSYSANANLQMLVLAQGAGASYNSSDTSSVYNTSGDGGSVPLSGLYVCQTSPASSCTVGGSDPSGPLTAGFKLSQTEQALYGTSETGVENNYTLDMYWFLTTPSDLTAGTYLIQYNIDFGNAQVPT